MTIKIDLRAEADAEAARIRAIKEMPPAETEALPSGRILAAVRRHATTAGINRSVAIFFTRTRIVDGSGRLVEDLVVPIEVRSGPSVTVGKRREIGRHTQTLFDRCVPQVRAVCLAEIARRITDLASRYGRGLERARRRESQLAELAAADRALAQPGLFDRRGMNERPVIGLHGRKEALDNASSLLVAQQSEATLLLIVGPAA